MSNEKQITPAFIEKLKAAKTPHELMEIAKAEGITLDEQASEKWLEKLQGTGGSHLLGGCSTVHCPKCGSSDYSQVFIGDSFTGGMVHCHCNSCGYDVMLT